MERFDVWDIALLLTAGYLAVISLVRLMAARRRRLTNDLYAEFRAEQERKRLEEKRKQRQEKASQQRTRAA